MGSIDPRSGYKAFETEWNFFLVNWIATVKTNRYSNTARTHHQLQEYKWGVSNELGQVIRHRMSRSRWNAGDQLPVDGGHRCDIYHVIRNMLDDYRVVQVCGRLNQRTLQGLVWLPMCYHSKSVKDERIVLYCEVDADTNCVRLMAIQSARGGPFPRLSQCEIDESLASRIPPIVHFSLGQYAHSICRTWLDTRFGRGFPLRHEVHGYPMLNLSRDNVEHPSVR